MMAGPQALKHSIQCSSLAALAGVISQFLAFYLFGAPLLTDAIAEWIMARTPSSSAVWLLATFGGWAKPFAVTGGLAALGFGVWLAGTPRWLWPRWEAAGAVSVMIAVAVAASVQKASGYSSLGGQFAFWAPAIAVALFWPERFVPGNANGHSSARRRFLSAAGRFTLPALMGGGVAGVAIESFLRNEALARSAAEPVPLFPYTPPEDTFGEGLVRAPVTPTGQFYAMSKNTVDPVIDPREWRLRVTVDGQTIREFSYGEMLSLPRRDVYVSLRCVSNTLRSNLMGNALWSGIGLAQLVERASLPPEIVEAAVIGVDGHGDSFQLDYAFSRAVMLALGMNGKTLDRTHGFPVRLIAPRYYGFKHIKWIGEIAFVSRPYFGTWPKMGYTKTPVIHTVSFIDKVAEAGRSLRIGGIAMSGHGPIRRVQLRADGGPWIDAQLEPPLSPYAWTRWKGEIGVSGAEIVQARAMDDRGEWQASEEGPLFPDGVKGPTIRKLT